eukprot:UN09362
MLRNGGGTCLDILICTLCPLCGNFNLWFILCVWRECDLSSFLLMFHQQKNISLLALHVSMTEFTFFLFVTGVCIAGGAYFALPWPRS